MSSEPKIITFGCRLNIYESALLKTVLEKNNINDVVVVNTCAVTAEAERKARQAVRRALLEDQKILVTGCAATINKKTFEELASPNVIIIPNEKKNDIEYIIKKLGRKTERVPEELPMFSGAGNINDNVVQSFKERARAFLPVQTGCDNCCSFCIIRLARGKSVSFPFEKILRQANVLVENGYKELNITGVDISSYKYGKLANLGLLIKELLEKLPHDVKIRLSSLDPACFDDDLFEAFYDERLLPHAHFSLQSGDDAVLKLMLRRHKAKDIYILVQKLREIRKNIVFGADIIVGFPRETDEMFFNTCKLVKEANISLLHIFPYSDRLGTVAETLTPKVPGTIKKQRLKELNLIKGELISNLASSFINKNVNLLIEKKDKKFLTGKTEHFLPIQIALKSKDSNEFKIGTFINVNVSGFEKTSKVIKLTSSI